MSPLFRASIKLALVLALLFQMVTVTLAGGPTRPPVKDMPRPTADCDGTVRCP